MVRDDSRKFWWESIKPLLSMAHSNQECEMTCVVQIYYIKSVKISFWIKWLYNSLAFNQSTIFIISLFIVLIYQWQRYLYHLQIKRPHFFFILWLTDFGPCPSKRRPRKKINIKKVMRRHHSMSAKQRSISPWPCWIQTLPFQFGATFHLDFFDLELFNLNICIAYVLLCLTCEGQLEKEHS